MGAKAKQNGSRRLTEEQRLELVYRLENHRLEKRLSYPKLAYLIGCGGRKGSTFAEAVRLDRAFDHLIAAQVERYLESVHA